MKKPKKPQKLWVAKTRDLQYDLCGLGTTKAQAEQAVWDMAKSRGLPLYGKTLAEFRDNYMHSFQLAVGEAVIA